jgi:hypothetical protein
MPRPDGVRMASTGGISEASLTPVNDTGCGPAPNGRKQEI